MPNKKDEYCHNCMEEIITEPIPVEIEETIFRGEEGMKIEMDVPVIIYFCSDECKEEYFNNDKK